MNHEARGMRGIWQCTEYRVLRRLIHGVQQQELELDSRAAGALTILRYTARHSTSCFFMCIIEFLCDMHANIVDRVVIPVIVVLWYSLHRLDEISAQRRQDGQRCQGAAYREAE
jgi:hypothetical protein